jgi:lambda repressor-like predicted transcriptional regulator
MICRLIDSSQFRGYIQNNAAPDFCSAHPFTTSCDGESLDKRHAHHAMINRGYQIRLRAGLAARQLNLAALADRLGVSRQALHNPLSTGRPGKKYPKILAKLLGTTETWLLDGTGTPPKWWTNPPAPEAERPIIDKHRRPTRRGMGSTKRGNSRILQSVLARIADLERSHAATTAAYADAKRENDEKSRRIRELEAELASVRELAADVGRTRTKTG